MERKCIYNLYQLFMLTILGVSISFGNLYAQEHTATLSPGQSITAKTSFATAAAGFQWYRNGVAIPGAVNATYVINVPGTYSVQAYNLESCPSPMSESFEIKLRAISADVAVKKVSESRTVVAGETFSYTLTAMNKLGTPATNVILTDTLPANLTYLSNGAPNIGTAVYDNASRVLRWTIPVLDANVVSTLNLQVRSQQGGIIKNTATITETETDALPSDNTATDVKQINPLIIPNVFTPNGDGKNDSFMIPTLLASATNEIQIFNRWGNLIYEKKNYNNEWTGDGLNEGTYFYILKAQNTDSAWDVYKGYVTLLRSKQL